MKPEEVNIENVYAYYNARLTQQETEKETLESRRDLSMDKLGRLCVLAFDIKMTRVTVEALGKQIPMKPQDEHRGETRDGRSASLFTCPKCCIGTNDRETANHCTYCGQKIDWEE